MGSEPLTFDGRFTMKRWWQMADRAQRTRGKARLLKPFIRAFDRVFDIGSARGMMTLVLRWCGGVVVAVDPMYAAAPELVAEFDWKFGDDPHVEKVPLAISPEPWLEFWVHKGLPYMSSGNPEWMWETIHKIFYGLPSLVKHKVQTTTLDSLIESYDVPAFIKVDVEGDENNVVPTLTQPVAGMSMEFHQDWIPEIAIAHMNAMADYDWNYVLNNTGKYVLDKWIRSEAMLEHMKENLEERGPLSWGDLYCRREDVAWPSE